MTKAEQRWVALGRFNNETVRIWLDDLLESKDKMFVDELTDEELRAEIEEMKGSIGNFSLMGDRHAVVDAEEYIEILKEMLGENEASDQTCLTDITGTLGEWLDNGFGAEVPKEVVKLVSKAYKLATAELDK